MYDLMRLGTNIKSLRNAYGETQEELGTAIFVEKNTISSYETGTREPKKDTLSAIARHFMVSVEELLYSDLSDIGKIKIDNFALWKNMNIVLPLVVSKAAMKNDHFVKAYSLHKNFYERMKQISLEDVDRIDAGIDHGIDVCFEEYMEAYEDETIEEAAANLIALWYLFLMMIKNTSTIMKEKPAALMQVVARDQKAKKIIENPNPTLEKDTQEALKDLDDPEFDEMMSELKITLKKSARWSDLADYYLALQYVWNLVDNDLTADYNRRVGFEMLKTLISVENMYAARYLKFAIGAMGLSSSRTVDDNKKD